MNKTPGKLSLWGCCHKLSLVGAIACFVVLLLTGFSPVLTGSHMTGYVLMVHAVCSPLFVLCMAVLALSWSQQHAFTITDWQVRNCFRLIAKTCYWLLLLLMLPLTFSIVLSMFPWFDTHELEMSFNLHRYSGMVFSVAAVLYTITCVSNGRKDSRA